MPLDFMYICGTQVLPLIGYEKLVFYYGLIFYPFLTLSIDYIYFFKFKWGVEGLGLGWTTAELFLFTSIWFIYF